MASGKIRVGNTEVLICSDGTIEPTLEVHFPSVSAEQMAPYFERYPETKSAQGNLVDPMGFFILRSGGKTILVDTGIGPGPVEAFGGIQGCLPDELEQQGVRADEIDIVVLTHLHTPKSTGPLDNHLSKIEYARGDTIPTTILRGGGTV